MRPPVYLIDKKWHHRSGREIPGTQYWISACGHAVDTKLGQQEMPPALVPEADRCDSIGCRVLW
jgi:hypothetical protein